MKAHFRKKPTYTEEILCGVVLLTFILLFIPCPALSEDRTQMSPMPILDQRPDNSTIANADRDAQLRQLRDYIKKQGPALIPGLPGFLRTPADFAMDQLRGAKDMLDMDEVDAEGILSPMLSILHAPDENDNPSNEAVWVQPGYNHARGVLPFDDSLSLGVNYRNNFVNDRVKLSVHPYYAQSWHSSDSYWGIETAIGIGPNGKTSWGAITMRYNDGDDNLITNGPRGFDMHADLNFNEHLNLSAGAQQTDSEQSNYMLLRWKAKLGEVF